MTRPTRNETAPVAAFPTTVVGISIAATLGVVLALTGLNLALQGTIRQAIQRDLPILELRGRVLHLDEVLTMSAKMAAATGDAAWDARYHRYAPELDAVLARLLELSQDPRNLHNIRETSHANLDLVNMEEQAFAFVRAQDRGAAQALLASEAYVAQKRRYAEGMDAVWSRLQTTWQTRLEALSTMRTHMRVWTIAGLLLLAVCWWQLGRTLRRWARNLHEHRRRLEQQALELSTMNDVLDARIMERTAELTQLNDELRHAKTKLEATVRERTLSLQEANAQLEQDIHARTLELQQTNHALKTKVKELELLNRSMMGREERIIELKTQLKMLQGSAS